MELEAPSSKPRLPGESLRILVGGAQVHPAWRAGGRWTPPSWPAAPADAQEALDVMGALSCHGNARRSAPSFYGGRS